MKLSDFLTKDAIIESLRARGKNDALKEISEKVSVIFPSLNGENLFRLLKEREDVCSTALDRGVAVPHLRMPGLSGPLVAFARSRVGIDFNSLDGKPTHLFMIIIASDSRADEYINLLARATGALKKPGVRRTLLEAPSQKEILETLIEEDNDG